MATTSFTSVSPDIIAAMVAKSAASLPDNPTDSGLKAADIKTALTAPMLDRSDSLLFLIERLIEECEQNRADIEARLSGSGI